MNDPVYPVDLRRRFEQRWAARFSTVTAVKPVKPRKTLAKMARGPTTISASQLAKKRIDRAS